jgi:hypothetical protein
MELSMQEKLAALRARQPQKNVSWKVGKIKQDATKGQALPYLKARVIRDLLDSTFGSAGWRDSIIPGPGDSVICTLELKIDGEWVGKTDGAQVDNYKPESDHAKEMAYKGAFDSAFQRAAVKWGIGRYLYEHDIQWVELKDGKFLAEQPKLPASLLPEGEGTSANSAVKAVSTPAPAPAPKAEAPAPKPAAPAPAPVVKADAPAPAPVDEVAEANERASAAVDAAISGSTAAKAPVAAAPAPAAPAEESTGTPRTTKDMPAELVEGLDDKQLKTVNGLLEKINKPLPFIMLRNYVKGPAATELLPESVRTYLLGVMDKADAAKA